MGLRKRQSRFVQKKALLIQYAILLGYELTDGDAYRDSRCSYGHPKSLHRKRLAQDFNIFKDGVLLEGASAEKAHGELHDFWDFLGGNKRIAADLNHYSDADGTTGMR